MHQSAAAADRGAPACQQGGGQWPNHLLLLLAQALCFCCISLSYHVAGLAAFVVLPIPCQQPHCRPPCHVCTQRAAGATTPLAKQICRKPDGFTGTMVLPPVSGIPAPALPCSPITMFMAVSPQRIKDRSLPATTMHGKPDMLTVPAGLAGRRHDYILCPPVTPAIHLHTKLPLPLLPMLPTALLPRYHLHRPPCRFPHP